MQLNLEYLLQIAKTLAGQFGKHCEVVVYDVVQKDLDYAIVALYNGSITGRKVGDGCSEELKRLLREAPQLLHDKSGYSSQGAQGRALKSSITFFRDEVDKIRYILEVNLDVTHLTALEFELSNFLAVEKEVNPTATVNVHGVLDTLLEEMVDYIGKPVGLMTKEEKVKAIEFLNTAGAFLITRSGDKVAQFFGISKFTLYSYMGKDNPRSKQGEENEGEK